MPSGHGGGQGCYAEVPSNRPVRSPRCSGRPEGEPRDPRPAHPRRPSRETPRAPGRRTGQGSPGRDAVPPGCLSGQRNRPKFGGHAPLPQQRLDHLPRSSVVSFALTVSQSARRPTLPSGASPGSLRSRRVLGPKYSLGWSRVGPPIPRFMLERRGSSPANFVAQEAREAHFDRDVRRGYT
jgi:hypothetical protein